MIEIWNVSETYTHGYLILPISLWLIWRRRHELRKLDPAPAYWPLGVFVLVLAVWAIARITSVLVVEQLAFIALIDTCVWIILGHRVMRELAFPLFFLFLSVPMGQDLVPMLMDFTADFTVRMLELTGIPVYREGLYFEVPTGRWSVVEACSGIRYLIASVTLGLLYAYLVYASFWRRFLFVVLSILVPILANGLRAYFIVLIGHLSDMKLAVGLDHLIYGWVFFGIVMALLFWVGSFWSEHKLDAHPENALESDRVPGSIAPIAAASVLTLVLAYPVSARVEALVGQERVLKEPTGLPEAINGWEVTSKQAPQWGPYVDNPAHEVFATYRRQDAQVSLSIAMFPMQKTRSEAISSTNRVIDPKAKGWKILRRRHRALPAVGISVGVTDVERLVSGDMSETLRIWDWYRIGAYHETDPYVGKLREVQNFLIDGRTDGAFITVATRLGLDEDAANTTLRRFVQDVLPSIDQTVDRSVFGDLHLRVQ